MVCDSEVNKLQCKVKTEPKKPLFSLILNPSDSFVSVLFWGDGERWAAFVHFSGYKSQLWPRTSGTSLINGFVSRSPLLMPYHDIDRMGEGFMICSALCKERNGHFSWRAGDLLCPSPAPACQGLPHSLLIATSVGCSWSQRECQGVSVQTSLQPSASLAG